MHTARPNREYEIQFPGATCERADARDPSLIIVRDLLSLRGALRRLYPDLKTTDENSAISYETCDVLRIDQAAARALATDLGALERQSAALLFTEAAALLRAAGHVAEDSLYSDFLEAKDPESVQYVCTTLLKDARSEVIRPWLPRLVALSALLWETSFTDPETSLRLAEELLEFNKTNGLVQDDYAFRIDEECVPEICKRLPEELFLKLNLKHVWDFIRASSFLSHAFSEADLKWQADVVEDLERFRRLRHVAARFSEIAPNHPFVASLHDEDRVLVAPLLDSARAFHRLLNEFYANSALTRTDLHPNMAMQQSLMADLFLATKTISTRYSEILPAQLLAFISRAVRGHFAECKAERTLTAQSTNPDFGTTEALLLEISTRLSYSERTVLERLSSDPTFPLLLNAYRSAPEVLCNRIAKYSEVSRCFDPGHARDLIDRRFLDQMLYPLHSDLSGFSDISGNDDLATQPLFWGFRESLAGQDPGFAQARALMICGMRQDKGEVPIDVADFLYDQVRRYCTAESTPFPLCPLRSIHMDLKMNESLSSDALKERFPSTLNKALNYAVENDIDAAFVLTNNFLTLLATHPFHAEDACKALLKLKDVVEEAPQDSTSRARALYEVSGLLLILARGAELQGRPLFESTYSHWTLHDNRPLRVDDIILSIRSEEPPSLTALTLALGDTVRWWDTAHVLFNDKGYPEKSVIQLRRELGDGICLPHMMLGGETRFWIWSCFMSPDGPFPSVSDIAATLKKLLPYEDPPLTEDGFLQYERFMNMMVFEDTRGWSKDMNLPQLCDLFLVYEEAYQDGHRSPVPLKQLLLSAGHPSVDPQALNAGIESAIRSGSKGFKQLVESYATRLATVPDTVDLIDPLDVLLFCLVAGVDHAEFSSRRSVSDVVREFNEKFRTERPPADKWPQFEGIARLRRIVHEKSTVKDPELLERTNQLLNVVSGMLKRVKPAYAQLRNRPSLEAGDSITEVFLGELLSEERYYAKFQRLMESRNSRDRLLGLIEICSEGLAGGIKDNISCTKDLDVRQKLYEALELGSLFRFIDQEFLDHESDDRLRDRELEVAFRPTLGVLTEFAGHICDTCLTRVNGLTTERTDILFVPFIKNPNRIRKNDPAPSFCGGALVVETVVKSDSGEEERALMIRGFNPTMSLLRQVRTSDVFNAFVEHLTNTACRMGISKIVAPIDPTWGIALTNRPFVFTHVRSHYYGGSAQRLEVCNAAATAVNGIEVREVVVIKSLISEAP